MQYLLQRLQKEGFLGGGSIILLTHHLKCITQLHTLTPYYTSMITLHHWPLLLHAHLYRTIATHIHVPGPNLSILGTSPLYKANTLHVKTMQANQLYKIPLPIT